MKEEAGVIRERDGFLVWGWLASFFKPARSMTLEPLTTLLEVFLMTVYDVFYMIRCFLLSFLRKILNFDYYCKKF